MIVTGGDQRPNGTIPLHNAGWLQLRPLLCQVATVVNPGWASLTTLTESVIHDLRDRKSHKASPGEPAQLAVQYLCLVHIM